MMERPHVAITTKDIAKLIKKCAFEQTNAGVYTNEHNLKVCIETARGMGMESFSNLVHLMLDLEWNATLDWADKELNLGALAGLEEM